MPMTYHSGLPASDPFGAMVSATPWAKKAKAAITSMRFHAHVNQEGACGFERRGAVPEGLEAGAGATGTDADAVRTGADATGTDADAVRMDAGEAADGSAPTDADGEEAESAARYASLSSRAVA